MNIDRIETFSNEFVGIVRVTTEDGSQGWGQMAPYNVDITSLVMHRQIAPWALGADALDIDTLQTLALRHHRWQGHHPGRARLGCGSER